MTKPSSISCVAILFLLLSTQLGNAAKPNFIVIFADDLGIGDVGAYRTLYPGEDDKPRAYLHTPHIDQLAEGGVICTRAYATGWCAPSRQALFSGRWVNRVDAYDQPWIGNQLRKIGYTTGMVGKVHGLNPIKKIVHNRAPETAEFDDGFFFPGGARGYYLSPNDHFPGHTALKRFSYQAKTEGYLTDLFTDQAVDFIQRHAEKPFMLHIAYTAPHDPLQGKPADLRALFPDTFKDLSDAQIRKKATVKTPEMLAMHCAALVYALDRGVGAIRATLNTIGIDDCTTIIFTSDNGSSHGSNYPLTGHKWDALEGGVRVPFIVWSKQLAASRYANRHYDGLVSLVDIAPTLIAQATGQPTPYPTDGIDLTPYLSGKQHPPTGRYYFWANTSYPKHLSGIPAFTQPPRNEQIVQSLLIKDDEKVFSYQPTGTKLFGAVYARLPDAVGLPSPTNALIENTPMAGVVPSEQPLYQELLKLIRTNPTGLVPQWSGQPTPYRWWFPGDAAP